MSISPAQLLAARENGKKSHGPVTEAGRERSSQNRRTHGMCGAFKVQANESQEKFDAMLAAYVEAEQPANDIEHDLVVYMVQQRWVSQRALRYQEACINPMPATEANSSDGKMILGINSQIEVYLRYQVAADRAYDRYAADLAKRKKARESSERGFESQRRAEEKHEQQKFIRESREARAQNEEKRKEDRHQMKKSRQGIEQANREADFELKFGKILSKNPNFVPPGLRKVAA